MVRKILSFAGISLVAGLAFAQAVKPLEFEVVSIKPSSPDARGSFINLGDAETFTTGNIPLHNLITFAYDIRDLQLRGGPGWVGTERFDVIAKTPREELAPGATDIRKATDEERKTRADRVRERVRTMLAERFGLVVHKETKEETVYFLMIAKGGSKMTPVTVPGDQQGMRGNGRGHMQGMAATVDMLTNMLTGATGHPVRDKTELTGKYDWALDYKPEGEGPRQEGADASEADTRPTIFTAVQEQLGLRLESGKGPVDLVVIDQVNKPTEN